LPQIIWEALTSEANQRIVNRLFTFLGVRKLPESGASPDDLPLVGLIGMKGFGEAVSRRPCSSPSADALPKTFHPAKGKKRLGC